MEHVAGFFIYFIFLVLASLVFGSEIVLLLVAAYLINDLSRIESRINRLTK